MNIKEKICLVLKNLSSPSPYEVTYLFVNLRILLEENKSKDSFSTLNLYCNWLVHPKLDRSAKNLIETLQQKVSEHLESGSDFNQAMSDVLGISQLERELDEVLSKCNISTVKQESFWINILRTLFLELIDKPLISEQLQKNEYEIYPKDFYGVQLIEYESKICWELLSTSLEIQGSRIIGDLVRTSRLG